MKLVELHLDSNNEKIAVNPLNIAVIVKLSDGTRIYYNTDQLRSTVKENYETVLMRINDVMETLK